MKLTEITIPNLNEAQHEALDGVLRDDPEWRVLGRYKGTDNVAGPYCLDEKFRLHRAMNYLMEWNIPFSAAYARTYEGKGSDDVASHLWSICHEAGLEVMAELFEIVTARGECDDESILALTAEDVSNWYDHQVGPAVDAIEDGLLNREATGALLSKASEAVSTRGTFTTLTAVVRGQVDEPEGVLVVSDELMFWGGEPGITQRALDLGADPDLWDHDDD